MSEDIDISTKIQITADRNDLYELEFPDPKMAVILELLMRRYTGLFSWPVPIDEEYVAAQTGITVPMLRQLLYRMSLEHVIKYIPCDHATVIFLHHDRLHPKNVNLAPERYEMLKEAFASRMQKMMDYVEEDNCCRSRYLLEYFGQTESSDCGTCDICRSGVKTSEIVRFINDEMSGKYTLDDISRRFNDSSCLARLRRLIDEGTVPKYM